MSVGNGDGNREREREMTVGTLRMIQLAALARLLGCCLGCCNAIFQPGLSQSCAETIWKGAWRSTANFTVALTNFHSIHCQISPLNLGHASRNEMGAVPASIHTWYGLALERINLVPLGGNLKDWYTTYVKNGPPSSMMVSPPDRELRHPCVP